MAGTVKKHMLFVSESLHCGGAEKSLVTLLQYIDYEAWEVDLMMLVAGGEFDKFVPSQVNVHIYDPFQKLNKLQLLSKRAQYLLKRKSDRNGHDAEHYWQVFGASMARLKKIYDVAIGYSQGFATYFVAEKVKAKKRYAWLNTDFIHAGYNASFNAPFYERLDQVVAVSPEGKVALQKAMESIDKKLEITVIKDISDPEIIRQQSLEAIKEVFAKDVLNIVTVCRLEPPKGLDLALDACAILVQQGLKLHWYFVGDGTLRQDLEQQAKTLGIDNYVSFLGFRENPYPYMKAGDLYVQSSRYEGLGLTLIEARLLGLPLISTNFPTAYHIIEQGPFEIIVPMEAPALAEAIQKINKLLQQQTKITRDLSALIQDKSNTLQLFRQLIEESIS